MQFIATIITAMLLQKTKNVEELKVKLNNPNFGHRAFVLWSFLSQYGVSLQAAIQLHKNGWFTGESPEQLEDWIQGIVKTLKTEGYGSMPAEIFSDLENLGGQPAAGPDDDIEEYEFDED